MILSPAAPHYIELKLDRNTTLNERSVKALGATIDYRMMTSSNENIFRVTGPFCGEFTGHWWIPFAQASDAELWYFLWFAHEQTVE